MTTPKRRKVRHQFFKFRKGMTVGEIAAEFDTALQDVFLDTGDLDILADASNPRSVVVGRTGAGKTALLLKLERTKKHVLRIHPDALSLQYLSNSTILPRLAETTVMCDVSTPTAKCWDDGNGHPGHSSYMAGWTNHNASDSTGGGA